MGSERIEPFADHWAYLKAELNWLERMLMQMVAQQRREHKAVERVAQNRADRVTSHWWKGLISLEGEGKYDDSSLRKPSPPGPKLTHQQQMEARIQASQQKGIVLRLPLLRDRLGLTVFEKNLILLCLAPEINRRYARIYRYLHSETAKDVRVAIEVSSACSPSDLPTVDLALSLLCRNDVEWRAARSRLVAPSPLVQWGLLEIVSCGEEALLSRRLKLADTLTNYLLSDQADALPLEALLEQTVGAQTNAKGFLQLKHPTMTWAELVLPPALQEPLQLLRQRSPFTSALNQADQGASPGTLVLFTGPTGTGKTAVAEAIAQSWQTPLTMVDLALLPPDQYPDLLQEVAVRAPSILLIKTAQHWLGRSSAMLPAQVEQFLQQRRQSSGLTIFTALLPQSIKWRWRQTVDQWLQFPLPNVSDRLQLWQRAFPAGVELDAEIDWEWIARKGAISGGEIQRLAQSASLLAAAESSSVSMRHLRQAWKYGLKG